MVKIKKQLNRGRREKAVAKIAVYNLFQRELEDEAKVNEVARAVIGAILSIPLIGLKEADISLTFPRDFTGKPEKVSVVITEESLFQEKVNSEVRQNLRRRVRGALQPVLRRKSRNISVEIWPK